MALIIIGVVVVILIVLICATPKGSETQGKGSAPAKNQYPYGMVWPEPKPDDLWDSFDYFVRLGEVRARHYMKFDEEVVYLTLCLRDTGFGKNRGDFELRTAEFKSTKRVFPDIPYLQDIELPFEGSDPVCSMLTMEQSEIRRLIMEEAEHAIDIRFEIYGDYLSLKVMFRGIN